MNTLIPTSEFELEQYRRKCVEIQMSINALELAKADLETRITRCNIDQHDRKTVFTPKKTN